MRILQLPILTAIERVNPITPCFEAQYTGWNATGISPLAMEMKTVTNIY